MKLNKITFQWLIYHALHSDTAGHAELKIIEEIEKALSEDTLDIEGYERVQWTRFDPKNPNTFPPFGHYLCAYKDDEVYPAYRSDKCNDEIFASLPHDITYWHPFPNPPAESEEQNEKKA